MREIILPSAFLAQMKGLLPADFENFEAVLKTAPPVSIRLNAAKVSPDQLTHLPLGSPVRWHPDAYYLTERPNFTLDPCFHAGAYYVQEASSMYLYEVLQQTAGPERPLRILDLCAAPGGKTTLIASWMPEGALLIANEVIRSRVSVLKENLVRWGHPHVFTCSYDPEAFLPLAGWFDLVVVDAPCSGEGLFRKNEQSRLEWSPANVALCAARQQRILNVAQKLVAPRGTLVYSTCTYNRLENDANAAWLVKEKGMAALQPDSLEGSVISLRSPGYQFYPHKAKGEGFYIAAFRQLEPIRANENRKRDFNRRERTGRKENAVISEWIREPENFVFLKDREGQVWHFPAGLERDLLVLDNLLPQGVWLHQTGQIKGRDFIPSHSLALQKGLLAHLPSIELTEQDALRYLKKELTEIPPSEKGWLTVNYHGLPLGWIRNLGNRFNNYFPTDQRIRIDLR